MLDAHVAIKPICIVLASILRLILYEDHALLEFKLDEVLIIIEDLLEIFLRIVVELSEAEVP